MKAYTDISQSRKLAEILPLDSADMMWKKELKYRIYSDEYKVSEADFIYYPIFKEEKIIMSNFDVPCWSLASLLEQLDDEITDKEGNDYNLTIVKESSKYQLYYHDLWGRAEDIETDYYDDMVDACYEMIIKLKEMNLI